MKVRLGNPVVDADFFPRPEILGRLVNDLLTGRGSRRMFGLRRTGKSSIVLEVERQLRAAGHKAVVFLDVQGRSSFDDMMTALVAALPASEDERVIRARVFSKPVFQRMFAGISALVTQQPPAPEPKGFASEFALKQLWAGSFEELFDLHKPLILILDELPFMIRNMLKHGYKPTDIEQFMAILRSWRQNCGVRMLMTGSLGFGELARLHDLDIVDTISDIPPVGVPPLTPDQAIQLVDRLAAGEMFADWTPEHSQALVEGVAETWPYFLQAAVDEVRRNHERRLDVLRAGPGPEAGQMLEESFYVQFKNRLDRYGDLKGRARLVLKHLCASDTDVLALARIDELAEGLTGPDPRDRIVSALVEDDFVRLDTRAGQIALANRLVRTFVHAQSWGR